MRFVPQAGHVFTGFLLKNEGPADLQEQFSGENHGSVTRKTSHFLYKIPNSGRALALSICPILAAARARFSGGDRSNLIGQPEKKRAFFPAQFESVEAFLHSQFYRKSRVDFGWIQ